MTFPLTFACALLVIGAFWFGLKLAATFDGRRPLAHRNFLRDATPPHHQGREADFDEYGRPW